MNEVIEIPEIWRGGKYGDGSHDVEIDGKMFRCSDRLSGASILACVGKDATYALYEVLDERPGHVRDRFVSPTDIVELHDGSKFYAIPV